MNNAVRGLKLIFCLASLSAGLTFAQSTSTEVAPAAAAAPIAHVYVGTTKGIYLYNASTTGKLTLEKSTPDATPAGLLVGVSGTHLISLGTHLLHSYQLSSSGVIGKQISEINTLPHYDGDCETPQETEGLVSINHTGRNIYIVFPPTSGGCLSSIQTYDISKTGVLTFSGNLVDGTAGNGVEQSPTIMANDTFAYAANGFNCCGQPGGWSGYKLESNGEMENWTFNLNYATEPDGYTPFYVTAGTNNYLAAIVAANSDGYYGPMQLASYTVDSQGNLSTTSTPANMPIPAVGGYPPNATGTNPWTSEALNMSPSGKLLSVGGVYGLQVFHFNGAAPITLYAVVAEDPIIRMHWDNNNHLYALSNTTHKLYVFTVTPTSITNVAGSPFAIPTGTPNALVVVPK